MSKSDTTLRQTMRHHNEPLRRANTTSTPNLRSTPAGTKLATTKKNRRPAEDLGSVPARLALEYRLPVLPSQIPASPESSRPRS